MNLLIQWRYRVSLGLNHCYRHNFFNLHLKHRHMERIHKNHSEVIRLWCRKITLLWALRFVQYASLRLLLDGGGDGPDNDGFCRRTTGNETVDWSCRTICILIPTNYAVNVITINHKVCDFWYEISDRSTWLFFPSLFDVIYGKVDILCVF